MSAPKLDQKTAVQELLDLARAKDIDAPTSPAEMDEGALAQLLDEVTAGQDAPPSLVRGLDGLLAAMEQRDGDEA